MNRLNVEDKRVENIKNVMEVFKIVCLVLAFIFVDFILTTHFVLVLLGIEAPERLQASLIAILIVLCVAWILYCVLIPIVDWCKKRNRKKQINNYEKE